ncbi:MAG: phosphotransferase [Pseudomonadota bacterium]
MLSDHQRAEDIANFLKTSGWADGHLNWLPQDASTRRYARLTRPDGSSAILMDAPAVEDQPCTPDMTPAERIAAGWNATSRLAASRVDAFVLIANHLQRCGLTPPEIKSYDVAGGLALIEDFGTEREFARLIERGAADETELYVRAAEQLAKLQACETPKTLEQDGLVWPIQAFDAVALRANVDLFVEWLPQLDRRMQLKDEGNQVWTTTITELIDRTQSMPRRFTLRDYHAENLLLLPSERIGLLDFQDAVLGWDAWDMAMLVQDARRPVSETARESAICAFVEKSGTNEAAFRERLAIIGALNALRITGLFARLQVRDGKNRYAAFMPRQQWLLAENLKHPANRNLARFIEDAAPFILSASE